MGQTGWNGYNYKINACMLLSACTIENVSLHCLHAYGMHSSYM